MRKKFKIDKIKTEGTMFLFFPRYCEKCITRFWLEMVPAYWSSWWTPQCPICGPKGFLWSSKKTAIKYHKESPFGKEYKAEHKF